jgi:DHA1 family bicyclomycin/chloramphenicol resistance-like MFS transporter
VVTAGRLILLGAIAALGSLATQVIVPALPALVAGIGATRADGQLVIAVYLVALAGSQLVWAPIADHFGRRPVLMLGIIVFLAGSLCCALAGNLATMLAGRAVQAVGAASALVTARAMATDRTQTGGAAASLAVLTSVTLISPAAAPAIGGAVTSLTDWRALFWLLAGLSATGLLLTARMLPETRIGDRLPLHPRALARRYLDVARGRGFLKIALSNALVSSGFYLFLAVSPFVLSAAGATPAQAGLFYSLVASAIIAGTLAVPPIVRRDPAWLSPIGGVVLSVGAIGLVLTAVTDAGIYALLATMTVAAFGSGLTGPALLAEAIERQRERSASVASLFGTLQMGSAALVSTAIVRVSPSTRADVALIGVLMLGAVGLRRWIRAAG